MSSEKINLHIPTKNQPSAMLNLLVDTYAKVCALEEFLFSELKLLQNPSLDSEDIYNMSENFHKKHKEYADALKKEIVANMMTVWAE